VPGRAASPRHRSASRSRKNEARAAANTPLQIKKTIIDFLRNEHFWYGIAFGSLIHAVLDTVAKLRRSGR
jgi:hypothetical protein